MGFQTAADLERFPAHAHRLSPVLTLQGAIAHCDMPLESGPTLYLPFSQTYLPGYLAALRDDFRAEFEARKIQLPLACGDAVFFNPAVIHAAGTNRSKNIRRIANLLQVSSAYGRAMESVDRLKMSLALYPALRSFWRPRRSPPRRPTTRLRLPPRATPSPPTSTATRRSAASRRKARRR